MTFETKERDLLARVGRLETKSGTVETPLLFPVINPFLQPVSPRKIHRDLGFDALMANAYLLKKNFQNEPAEKGLHRFLDFDRTIMTDSGAYQILVYGDIEVTPKEIVAYQEEIDTDIATILDWPTGWKVSRSHAKKTVDETLKRAKELFKTKTRDDILWVGPIQGGQHLDLVVESAVAMRKLPFQIYALGSPTEVMESYRFDVLADMIMNAKMNLPIEKPLHLFGAGHPLMFSLAVSLGCDLFDSAAYSIYARENRYMTENGTFRLNELEYFPCACPRCLKETPREVLEMLRKEREAFLAEHNLYISLSEIRRLKQAIKQGRLWEHLEMRAHGHPALLQALKRLEKYEESIEKHSPSVKNKGFFFFDSVGLIRPEIVRHRKRLMERYAPPKEAKILLLIPQTGMKPFHKSNEIIEIRKMLQSLSKECSNIIHICFYSIPFGVIPLELDEVYPLSQHETVLPPDKETVEYVGNQVANYICDKTYDNTILLYESKNWSESVLKNCEEKCVKKNLRLRCLNFKGKKLKTMLICLKNILQEALSSSLD